VTVEQGGFPGTAPIPVIGGPVRSSAFRTVLRSPLYRGATLALFLAGLGASAAVPQMSRYLVDELGAPLTVAGLFYLTNLTAPVAGFLIGRWSDRRGRRLGLFRICAAIGFVGWLLIAASTEAWMPFAISALVLAISGVSGSQLFAAVHDEITARRSPSGDGIVSIVRAALTLGWVIGPVLGSFLGTLLGSRWLFVWTAVCVITQLIPMGTLRTSRAAAHVAVEEARTGSIPIVRLGFRPLLPLLAFTALFVCAFVGDAPRFAYLPIMMQDDLRLSALESGAIIGVQPLVEICLMPLMILAARRIGPLPLMVLGALCAVAGYVCFAAIGSATGLWIGQILIGCTWGVFAALGIIVAQRLLPGAVATASGIFMTAPAITSAIGGLSGAVGIAALGLPHMFAIPAAFSLVAAVGLALLSRSRHLVRSRG